MYKLLPPEQKEKVKGEYRLRRAIVYIWALAVTLALGAAALAQLPTADAYCHMCSYFLAGSKDPAIGCPGDPGSQANKPINNSGPAFGAVTSTQEVLV